MVEQLVCAQAGVFVGTRLSTFTAFIQRMRGHMQRSSDSSTTPIINTGIYYTTNRPYKTLKLHDDELGETHRLLGQPVWGKAHERAWAA